MLKKMNEGVKPILNPCYMPGATGPCGPPSKCVLDPRRVRRQLCPQERLGLPWSAVSLQVSHWPLPGRKGWKTSGDVP